MPTLAIRREYVQIRESSSSLQQDIIRHQANLHILTMRGQTLPANEVSDMFHAIHYTTHDISGLEDKTLAMLRLIAATNRTTPPANVDTDDEEF